MPNYPKGTYPELSPNPNEKNTYVNGGQETPVIVVTQPKELKDTCCDCDNSWVDSIKEHLVYDTTENEVQVGTDFYADGDIESGSDVIVGDDLQVGASGGNSKIYLNGNEFNGVDATGQDSGKVLTANGSGGTQWQYPSSSNINSGSATSGQVLQANGSGGVTWGVAKLDATKCTYQTTAPSSAITDGGVHIVYLSSEPATKYDGYIYLIAE